jgi:hypothetical protein
MYNCYKKKREHANFDREKYFSNTFSWSKNNIFFFVDLVIMFFLRVIFFQNVSIRLFFIFRKYMNSFINDAMMYIFERLSNQEIKI